MRTMFWLDLYLGQLYCGGGESEAKVWTAGERENGEHQIGDLIKLILDQIGVTKVTFRMIQKTHCFFRGGNPIFSYILSSGAAANVSRLFHVWPPSTRGGWGYHHQDVFVVIIVNIIIGLKTTVLLSSKIKCPFPGETFLQVTRLLQGYIENEVKFQLFHKTWSYIYLQTDSQPSNRIRTTVGFTFIALTIDISFDVIIIIRWTWTQVRSARANAVVSVTCSRQMLTLDISAFNYAESTSCFKDLFCAKQPQCKGRIFDCQFFHADAVSSNWLFQHLTQIFLFFFRRLAHSQK